MKRALAWTLAAALSAGCATAPVPLPAKARPAVERAAGPVVVRVKSEIPEPYIVLSGPAQTYAAYRFNDRAVSRFEAYGGDKSGGGGTALEVLVVLRALVTGYREVGSRKSLPGVQVAFAGSGLPRALGRIAMDEGNGLNIPQEIHRSARLTGEAEVRRDGQLLLRKDFSAEVASVVTWEDYSRWVYDYTDVLHAVLEEAVVQADRIVDEARGSAP